MIIKETSFGFLENFDVVLPLGLTLSPDGERTVTTFDETLDAGELLEALPSEEIFTEKTKEALTELLAERFSELGYDMRVVFATEFRISDREKVNKRLILPSTEPLLPENDYENLTECEPDPLDEGLLCFGSVIDGRIVSAASENPHDPDDTVIDIGVETNEAYENRGLAASNTASLAYYLLDPGITVTYIAENDNVPSLRVAEKVGFEPNIRELRIVCEAKE